MYRMVPLYKFNEEGTHSSLINRKSYPDRKDVAEYKYVSCVTFNDFCKMNDLQEIELLCIDTEGLDTEILLSIDYDAINIKKIIWEKWGHDNDDKNDIYNTGNKILEDVKQLLTNKNYTIGEYDADNWEAVK